MRENAHEMDFGQLVKYLRHKKDWTVKQFIQQLMNKGLENLSPAYVTRIEVHGEIPNPELICRIADVFNYDENELLEKAKKSKVEQYNKSLEEKYQEAVGAYRLAKKNDDTKDAGSRRQKKEKAD